MIRSAVLAFALLASCASGKPWQPLFDGETLDGWHMTHFGGEGEVRVEDGAIFLEIGNPLNGVHAVQPPPTGNYELEVVAARMDGVDFFCGLTFPVGERFLTLVLGGWGGSTCGLSSIDGDDAANNPTMRLKGFEQGRDYTVLIRVGPEQVEVLLDGEPFTSTPRNDAAFSLRPEVEISRPLGIASFGTVARIKSVQWRPLTED